MPPRFRRRVAGQDLVPLLPVALLCLVALGQVWLTRTASLTPWKGGGFGMFSTTDRGDCGARPIRVKVSGPEGTREIDVPAGLSLEARRASVLPTEANLARLGRAVAALEGTRGGEVRQVSVEVWRRRHELPSLAPRLELLRETTTEGAVSRSP